MSSYKRVLGVGAELALAALFFGLPALLVAAPALWISRRYGERGARMLLAAAVALLGAAAIASAVTTTRLDALYADRRALAGDLAGLAAMLVLLSVLEFARAERSPIAWHRNAAPRARPEGPMRVVILAWRDLAHPQAGGSEVLVDGIARGLMDRGHEVTLVCGGPIAPRPYPVLRSGGRFTQYLRAPWVARDVVARADVVIDVENGIPFFVPLWSRTPVVCLVHHVHHEQWAQHFPRPVAAVGRRLERFGLRRVHRRSVFYTVSASTADALVELGIDRDRIVVAITGVEVPDACPAEAAEPLFVVLSRLVPHKRVELVLDAWRQVRAVTGGRLVIIGDGPERDRLVAEAPDGVEFAGFVNDAEKHELLSRAWLLVHAAHHEGWGIVIIEAAARNTPAVALDAPGVRDAIVHDSTGLLAHGVSGLANAWRALATDPTRRRALGDAARARARTLTWGATLDQVCATLERAARERPPDAALERISTLPTEPVESR